MGSPVTGECVSSEPSPNRARIDKPSHTQFANHCRSPTVVTKSVLMPENGWAIQIESVSGTSTMQRSSARLRKADETAAGETPNVSAMSATDGGADLSRNEA